jgi:DNA-binding response OmpR family regulator
MKFTWENFQTRQWMGQRISGRQPDLLLFLAVHSNRYCTVQEITEYLWPDPDKEPVNPYNNIRHIVRYILRKYGAGLIKSKVSYGYRLCL